MPVSVDLNVCSSYTQPIRHSDHACCASAAAQMSIIGDCYMATCGCPDSLEAHETAARIARLGQARRGGAEAGHGTCSLAVPVVKLTDRFLSRSPTGIMLHAYAHAAAHSNCSQDIVRTTERFCSKIAPDVKLQIRVGINSGPVVAAVLGSDSPVGWASWRRFGGVRDSRRKSGSG